MIYVVQRILVYDIVKLKSDAKRVSLVRMLFFKREKGLINVGEKTGKRNHFLMLL